MAPAGLTARIYVAPADPARGDISAWQRLCPSGDIFFDREAAGPYSGLMKTFVTMAIAASFASILPIVEAAEPISRGTDQETTAERWRAGK